MELKLALSLLPLFHHFLTLPSPMKSHPGNCVRCGLWQLDGIGGRGQLNDVERAHFLFILAELSHVVVLTKEATKVEWCDALAILLKKERIVFQHWFSWGQLVLWLHQVIRVEALIVHVDGLQELIQVVVHVLFRCKPFLADRAWEMQGKPFLNTWTMKDVVTIKHAAFWLILNRLQANGALFSQKLPWLEANEHFLDVLILHRLVPLIKQCYPALLSLLLSPHPFNSLHRIGLFQAVRALVTLTVVAERYWWLIPRRIQIVPFELHLIVISPTISNPNNYSHLLFSIIHIQQVSIGSVLLCCINLRDVFWRLYLIVNIDLVLE